jgi:beta-xylosidase
MTTAASLLHRRHTARSSLLISGGRREMLALPMNILKLAVIIILAAFSGCAAVATSARSYHNPILYADYSDPDVVRVGANYYLIASSFHYSPGIPLLESHDLLHWSIVGHAVARLDFNPSYDLPGPLDFTDATEHSKPNYALGYRYGSGIWAPAIRAHGGRLYIYFPTPTEGIFMTSAPQAAGPWDAPVRVMDQAGLEDPCAFWDEDGQAYLLHSRVGAGPLVLHKMSADGKAVLDAGKVIVEDPVHLPTLEGPKLYKRNGYYYIFAPFGGVETGSQAVLRSREIYGPYDFRIVLSKGASDVKGPHQGGYVETPSGEGWFVHFNSTGAYGRIVYLEPVRWEDDWPIIGERLPGAATGQPVQAHAVPDAGRGFAAIHPQTSDEFTGHTLAPQWEWNHNPDDSHWSLTERPGFLRLKALSATSLVSARNTLTQVLQGRAEQITVRVAVDAMADGQRAGLAMFGRRPSWIGVVQTHGQRELVYAVGGSETAGEKLPGTIVCLRMQVDDEQVLYSYSLDEGKTYRSLGSRVPMLFSWWKGARPALFTFNTDTHTVQAGSADFDWVRIQPNGGI